MCETLYLPSLKYATKLSKVHSARNPSREWGVLMFILLLFWLLFVRAKKTSFTFVPLFREKNWKKGWKKFQMSALSSHLFVTTRSLCHGMIINPHQHPPFLFSMEFFLRHHLLRYSSWKSVYITRSHVSLEGRRTIFCKNELTFPSGSNGSQCNSTSELLSLAISKNRPLPNCLFFPWNGPTIKG